MAIFRLLHLTDLHIATAHDAYSSCGDPYALRAIAEFLSNHRNNADLILITGDITDDGLQHNLDEAYRYITTPATDGWFVRRPRFAPTLDSRRQSGPPFFIMPGNHDRFRGPLRWPGGTAFDVTFGKYWHQGLSGVQSMVLPPKEAAKLALIAADFCLTNPAATPYFGQGRANPHVVAAMVEETRAIKAADPNVGIVWISHFPPLLDVEHHSKLWGAKKLLRAARDNNVKYVISGHLHRNQINAYPDINVICTGTASSMGCGELYGYWIQRLDVEVESAGNVSMALTKYRYKHADCEFVEE